VFTARYALSPYIKQIRFVFKGLKKLLDMPRPKAYAPFGGDTILTPKYIEGSAFTSPLVVFRPLPGKGKENEQNVRQNTQP
jgi:hypothetical protein